MYDVERVTQTVMPSGHNMPYEAPNFNEREIAFRSSKACDLSQKEHAITWNQKICERFQNHELIFQFYSHNKHNTACKTTKYRELKSH